MSSAGGMAVAQATPRTVAEKPKTTLVPRALRELQAHEDFIVEIIEPRLRPLITEVKHDMRAVIVEELKEGRPAGESAAEIRAAILRRFRSAGIRKRKDAADCYGCYAHGFDVRTEILTGRKPELLAVVLKIDIPWGDDSSLYIFERRGQGWTNVLASEINDYESVEKSQSRFRYKISPPAPDGGWFVVTGSVNNHAASAWHSVTFTALAPEGDPLRPRILARERHTIYLVLFDDETMAYRFRVAPAAFTVSFPTDSESGNMVWATYGYDVSQGSARPKPPVCHLGRLNGRVHPCPGQGVSN